MQPSRGISLHLAYLSFIHWLASNQHTVSANLGVLSRSMIRNKNRLGLGISVGHFFGGPPSLNVCEVLLALVRAKQFSVAYHIIPPSTPKLGLGLS